MLKFKKQRCAPAFYMGNNKSLIGELWDFLRVRKAWWMAPIIGMLVLVMALIIFGQASPVSPFIYALF